MGCAVPMRPANRVDTRPGTMLHEGARRSDAARGAMRVRVLLTNDDGIRAPGIRALDAALGRNFDVVVVAPVEQRSAASQSFTFGAAYDVVRLGARQYACGGTPLDCVIFGWEELGPFDMVVSGINRGANVGWDIWYSGTVGAAFEAARRRIPGLAVSLDVLPDAENAEVPSLYTEAAELLAGYLQQGVTELVAGGGVVNVNFPNSAEALRRRLQYATVAAGHYNRQNLVRRQTAPDRWEVHVEHPGRRLETGVGAAEADVPRLQSAPTLSLWRAPSLAPSADDERRCRDWLKALGPE